MWVVGNKGDEVVERKPKFTFSVEVGGHAGQSVLGGYTRPSIRFEVDELTPQLRAELIEAAGRVAAAAYDALERQEAIRLDHAPHTA